MHVDSHAGHLVEPMHVGHLLIADFTQQHTPKQPDANLRATSSSISRQALVKASSAAQCGGMGYSSNHIVHGQHRNKMLAATIAPQRHVIAGGKSGTELVGNIERDISIPLTITCGQLCFLLINNLKLLWLEWSCKDHFIFFLSSLCLGSRTLFPLHLWL
ncbi:hypothetical protein SERLA73DRAFT_157032 [Serpula lacrymans var. lacrymans S7.3]|uniref:Uncharacterized protein n=1 Tax=Serpula lacrymans var. lacrymans (strain S7.3) TaxID=936435 RepID=F8QH25_SERL3|nr:hypothetical protein SERLA73DRAFT_157032 [Serpula lacrymans var. lacrymans S7.3]